MSILSIREAPCLVLVAVALVVPVQGGLRGPEASEAFRRASPVLWAEEFGPGWQDRWTEESLAARATDFAVVEDDGNRVLRASSRSAASALTRPVDAGTREGLRVSWRWKVSRSLEGAHDERRRSGDDYAARVFVIFGTGGLASAEAALCYVWAASEPAGATYRSPYADEVATVVLRSGDRRAGRWLAEERAVGADFREAFGKDPGPVSAVALMADTDDTGGRATAWFDDVVVAEAVGRGGGPGVGTAEPSGAPVEALAAP